MVRAQIQRRSHPVSNARLEQGVRVRIAFYAHLLPVAARAFARRLRVFALNVSLLV
jgi:hypothetical protein